MYNCICNYAYISSSELCDLFVKYIVCRRQSLYDYRDSVTGDRRNDGESAESAIWLDLFLPAWRCEGTSSY